jgi:hypothetical protein
VSSSWTTEQLSRIEQARELEIASRRRDGTLGHRLPIWVVTVDGQVYVRSWHRRTTGWFGQVIKNRQAHVRVQGLDGDDASPLTHVDRTGDDLGGRGVADHEPVS